ncbi:DUF2950 family protein [bacterium]|nr:DUF2950 family protein [bacterium]
MRKLIWSLTLSLSVLGMRAGWCKPLAFSTPEEAVKALTHALAAKDEKPLENLFGPEVQKILDPSPELRKESRRLVQILLKERWKLSYLDDNRKLLRLGKEGWPFPVTLFKSADGWKFDTSAGIEEVRNRRIGTNELVNLETLTCIMLAEEDYYRRDANMDGVREYSSSFWSSTGKHDGLYWDVKPNQLVSPLETALKDSASYSRQRARGTPWWGYRYRFLSGQGSHAAGGAFDYKVNGFQVAGWAVIAYPVSHASSGYKTFICNQNGAVYQKDLGVDTRSLAEQITVFDPGNGWELVDPEDLPR